MNWERTKRILKKNSSEVAVILFCTVAFVLILAGLLAFRVPVVSMCILGMLEAGIAVMLHRAEIWIHALLVIAEIVAGVLVGRVGLIILCAAMYVAATAALHVLGEDE